MEIEIQGRWPETEKPNKFDLEVTVKVSGYDGNIVHEGT